MTDPIAAAIAFAALGANVLATALLLLFNPRSRSVRWYALFLSAVSVWLLSLGVLSIRGWAAGPWRTAFAAAVMMMPVVFAASALAEDDRRPGWVPWLVTGSGLALLPIGAGAMLGRIPAAGVIMVVWQGVGWAWGSIVHWRAQPRHPFAGPRDRRAYRLVLALLLVPPLAAIGGFVVGARPFFTYVMPIVIVAIDFLIFIGVVRLRFYDIEVRAARSVDIAGRAGEVERLAAVGEVAASIAHEVRNPLTGVRSLAQRMAEEQVEPERWRRYAAIIVEEVGRVDRIVGGLLSLARRGTLGPWSGAPTPLDPLFDDLALLAQSRAAQAGVTLRVERSGIIAPAPREALAQALLNLLLNALNHTPRGGTVSLGADSGDRVVLRVRDTGPGVPPAERERIFEPFHTGGPDGTGLGLSVVRRLARELDWELQVADAIGGGAEFRIRLPRAALPERPEEPARAESP